MIEQNDIGPGVLWVAGIIRRVKGSGLIIVKGRATFDAIIIDAFKLLEETFLDKVDFLRLSTFGRDPPGLDVHHRQRLSHGIVDLFERRTIT